MNIKLLQINLNHLTNFEEGQLSIDFFAEKRVYNHEKEQHVVSNLFSNINKLNNIALVGKNATGKTTTLNIISDLLKIYIENKSLSDCEHLANHFSTKLQVENIILVNKQIFKIKSIIKKDELNQLFFDDEQLYQKKATTTMIKDELTTFSKNELLIERQTIDNPFLKKDDSIFSSILNNENINESYLVSDLGRFTNFNFLGYFSKNMPLSFVNYLDPSIEEFYLEMSQTKQNTNQEPKFCVKFRNKDELLKIDFIDIDQYLSSGTIKGINILFNALNILKSGGYLLIDEIENHLNKSIVINLIHLFTGKLNTKGATIIFTTHYSEILDSIERSDSIYVLNKKEYIYIDKFSNLANKKDRIDKKKSDLILSGELNTSPSYFAYQKLKKDFKKSLNEEDI